MELGYSFRESGGWACDLNTLLSILVMVFFCLQICISWLCGVFCTLGSEGRPRYCMSILCFGGYAGELRKGRLLCSMREERCRLPGEGDVF